MKMNQKPTHRSGFSPQRLQRLTSVLHGYIEHEEIAGIVAVIHRHDTLAYAEAIGWWDKEAHHPMMFRLPKFRPN